MRILILMLLIVGSSDLTGNESVKPAVQSKSNSMLIKHLPSKPKYFNTSDIQCTAETIYSEARGEPEIGQHAVGYTIVNRSTKILHKRPCSIVKQQYTQRHIPKEDKHVFYSIAENVLNNKVPNPIGNLDSFDSFRNRPHRRGSIKIGNHYFYKALKITT